VPFGVYLHIPFCTRRCDYCAFATWTDRHHLISAYIEACRTELAGACVPAASSVFVGGGTPSLVPPALLASLIADVHVEEGAEVTVECNPETLTPSLLDALLDVGVNRLSFGVQSLAPHVLTGLGRTHDPAAARRAVRLARESGLAAFNVDLIFGGYGESDADWRWTLDEVVAMSPPHVSAYALTVEPGTPLAADSARHPDEDVQASRYLVAEEVLAVAGLRNYEISNWARPGYECRHNQLYWEQGNYRGIGCAAHSHADGRRWWNVRTPERYIDAIDAGRSAVSGCEELDAATRERERLELSLRTRRGVPASAVGDLDALLDAGVVAIVGERAVLTAKGRLVANDVALRLVTTG
jgi:oxygen-independent coproporphyrinogen-3 oxidase